MATRGLSSQWKYCDSVVLMSTLSRLAHFTGPSAAGTRVFSRPWCSSSLSPPRSSSSVRHDGTAHIEAGSPSSNYPSPSDRMAPLEHDLGLCSTVPYHCGLPKGSNRGQLRPSPFPSISLSSSIGVKKCISLFPALTHHPPTGLPRTHSQKVTGFVVRHIEERLTYPDHAHTS